MARTHAVRARDRGSRQIRALAGGRAGRPLGNSGTLTIQAAVDKAAATGGGTVKLCPGTYQLNAPVVLNGSKSVYIRGHGLGTVLRANGTAFAAKDVSDVVLSRFALLIGGDEGPGIKLVNGESVLLENLRISPGMASADADFNVGTTWQGIALASTHHRTVIRDCSILAPFGIVTIVSPTSHGPFLADGLRIEHNVLQCPRRGVDMPYGALYRELVITGNTIDGCLEAGISVLCAQGNVNFEGLVTVSDNVLELTQGKGTVTRAHASIVDNNIKASAREVNQHGIHITGGDNDKPGTVHVTGNRVGSFGGYGVLVEAPIGSALVKQNKLRGTASGIQVSPPVAGGEVAVDNNHIIDVVPLGAGSQQTAVPTTGRYGRSVGGTLQLSGGHPAGIRVIAAETVTVLGNTIYGVDVNGVLALPHIGIAVVDCADVRVTGNTVNRVGTDKVELLAIGIGVWTWTRTATVQDNTVHNGEPNGPGVYPTWVALNLDGAYENKAPLVVDGNIGHGGGGKPAVQIATRSDVILSSNVFLQPVGYDVLAVDARAASITMQGNQIRAAKPKNASASLDINPGPAIVIGNISSAEIRVNSVDITATGKPWSQLNAIAS